MAGVGGCGRLSVTSVGCPAGGPGPPGLGGRSPRLAFVISTAPLCGRVLGSSAVVGAACAFVLRPFAFVAAAAAARTFVLGTFVLFAAATAARAFGSFTLVSTVLAAISARVFVLFVLVATAVAPVALGLSFAAALVLIS